MTASTPLTGAGIGDLRIGDSVSRVRESCRVLADSARPGPEGSTERVLHVDVGRDTVTAVVADERIWRLHVDSPMLRTVDSLGVGSMYRDLAARPGATLAHGEGRAFSMSRELCGLSFALAGGSSAVLAARGAARDTIRVEEVLVVGCRETGAVTEGASP